MPGETRMVTRGAAFVTLPKPFKHFFWIVFMLNSCGALFIYCLEYRPPPKSIDDLFNRWSKMASNDHNSLLLTAASTLCWAVWITRNEVVFDKCRPKSLLQLLFRGTHWLRQWARLQRCDDRRDQLIIVGQHLETSALHFFGSNGWLSNRHIGLI